jgi:hypothetical protein
MHFGQVKIGFINSTAGKFTLGLLIAFALSACSESAGQGVGASSLADRGGIEGNKCPLAYGVSVRAPRLEAQGLSVTVSGEKESFESYIAPVFVKELGYRFRSYSDSSDLDLVSGQLFLSVEIETDIAKNPVLGFLPTFLVGHQASIKLKLYRWNDKVNAIHSATYSQRVGMKSLGDIKQVHHFIRTNFRDYSSKAVCNVKDRKVAI